MSNRGYETGTGRFLVAVAGVVALFLLARCSPLNSSVDKNELQKGKGPVLKPAITIIKVRDVAGDEDFSFDSGSQDRRVVTLDSQQLKEFKADGKLKIRIEGLNPFQRARFTEASLKISDHADELKDFEIHLERASRFSRDEWVLCVPEKVDAALSKKIQSSLETVELTFVVGGESEAEGSRDRGSSNGRGGRGSRCRH